MALHGKPDKPDIEGHPLEDDGAHQPPGPPEVDDDVEVPLGELLLDGHLRIPGSTRGAVVLFDGTPGAHHRALSQLVADRLSGEGFATLVVDLLVARSSKDSLDVETLASRLDALTGWLRTKVDLDSVGLGYFATAVGAAAALVAAARSDLHVGAIVSLSGRPDLASDALGNVRPATLLVTGGLDPVVTEHNESAAKQLVCEHKLVVVPGATHLFEEEGRLDVVADLARDWFATHLGGSRASKHRYQAQEQAPSKGGESRG